MASTPKSKTYKRKTTKAKGTVKKEAKKQPSLLWLWLRRLFALTIYGIIVGLALIIWYGWDLPDPADLLQTASRKASYQLLDRHEDMLFQGGEHYGEAVTLDTLPAYIPDALLAIEDHRFYSHFGLDPIAIIRAAYVNFTSGGKRQGGSTLTQQLAKTLFLTPEKTMRRKAQEALLSLWLELKFSKQQILEIYMSRVYMGGGNWGFSAAAQSYFNKDLKALNLRQATLLAALPLAPSRLNPHYNEKEALKRADLSLKRMVDEGYITSIQAEKAKTLPLGLVDDGFDEAHKRLFARTAIEQARDLMAGAGQDLIITTSLDRNMQRTAERVVKAFSLDIKSRGADQIAVLALDHKGGVRVMISGLDATKNRFNRTLLAKRQPGSSFKLFVYLTALEAGWMEDNLILDEPININGWQPQNYSQNYYGNVRLDDAFAASSNIVAVKLGLDVGVEAVIATARRLGVVSALAPHPSLFLGSSEVSLQEMVTAYASVMSDEDYIVPSHIMKIQDGDGRILYDRGNGSSIAPKMGAQSLQNAPIMGNFPQAKFKMRQLLEHTITNGTARQAFLPELAQAGWRFMGKTGTSQDYRDAWFIGGVANPQDGSFLTMGIWIGNDQATTTDDITGGSLPACIWREIIRLTAFPNATINKKCH